MPSLRIHAGDGRLHLAFRVQNLKRTPMDVMYLAHVNFRPVDNGRLIDTGSDDPAHVRIRTKIPGIFPPTPAHAALIAKLQADPALHRIMQPGRAIDPELVMGMDLKADSGGWSHCMQILPDGSADFISHKPVRPPRSCSPCSIAVRYARTTGPTYAFATVVLARGYSRISGAGVNDS